MQITMFITFQEVKPFFSCSSPFWKVNKKQAKLKVPNITPFYNFLTSKKNNPSNLFKILSFEVNRNSPPTEPPLRKYRAGKRYGEISRKI